MAPNGEEGWAWKCFLKTKDNNQGVLSRGSRYNTVTREVHLCFYLLTAWLCVSWIKHLINSNHTVKATLITIIHFYNSLQFVTLYNVHGNGHQIVKHQKSQKVRRVLRLSVETDYNFHEILRPLPPTTVPDSHEELKKLHWMINTGLNSIGDNKRWNNLEGIRGRYFFR